MGKAFFITGTDTGAGKTFVGRCLLRYFVEKNVKAIPFKPIETGVVNRKPEDGSILLEESKTKESLDKIVPYTFELPAAPLVAARKENVEININKIVETFLYLKSKYEVVMVEGAGGLLVPITHGISYAELVKILDIPMLVVARSKLGTINHTLLTLRVAKSYGIRVIAVVLNRYEGADYVELTNPQVIEELGNIKTFIIGESKEPFAPYDLGDYIYANI
ncbi:MAG: dethiobiotin synthase [Thermosulfidibacteraceae bacterium]|jgi:dethiobiotin synthetase